MAMAITGDCISCGMCEAECPHGAIREGDDAYIIDVALCTECEGNGDGPRCVGVCGVDCIVPLP